MPKALPTRPRPSTVAQDGLVVRRHGAHGRSYTYNGIKFVSNSEVKDCLRKRLENWSAECERADVLRVLDEVLRENVGKRLSRDWVDDLDTITIEGLATLVRGRLGTQYAWVKARTEAGNIGTRVHDAIEKWIAWRLYEQVGGTMPDKAVPELEGPARVSFDRFLEWTLATDFMPIACELSVCSPTDKWGGTLDVLAYVDGEPAILDWKSGGSLYLEDYMQISGYRHGYNEFEPARVKGVDRVDRAYLVHLPKKAEDAPTNIVRLDAVELDHHYATFACAVPLCYRMKAWEQARKAAA